MFGKVIPLSTLIAQKRWTVDFFASDGRRNKDAAYSFVRLKELLTERRETLDPQQHPSHRFHYLGLEHVQRLTGDLVDGYRPREGRDVRSRSKVFRRGDILYGRLRPILNKVFVAEGMVAEGICSGEFYVLVADRARLLPQFARALLASRFVQDVVARMTTGSALPRLALADLLAIEVPLPPLAQQERYEQMILAQNARRRELAAELRDGPAADLEALVTALEDGSEPTFARRPPCTEEEFTDMTLPLRDVPPASERTGER